MGIADTTKTLSRKLKLDSHHAAERFAIILGALVVTGVLLFTSSGVSAFSNTQGELTSKALYTPNFVTSKTQVSGTVPGVYVSEDRTRSMVLMKFADITQVSSNAADYQGFLTGSTMNIKPESLKNDVVGSVYMFGSSGYMGVMLDSQKPFTPQIMNLTMRSNSELVHKDGSTEAELGVGEDVSFQKYDQWRVFVNPGGSDAIVSPALSNQTLNVREMFNEIVTVSAEKVLRTDMDNQLAKMQTELARINDSTAELARTKADNGSLYLVPPVVPRQLGGGTLDEVTGKAKVLETASDLTLKTNFVMPTGYNFDWRSGSVMEGYLDQLVPAGTTFVSYLAKRATETEDSLRVNDLEWKLNTGEKLTDFSTGDMTMKPLFTVMAKLSKAYQDYYTDKGTYQIEMYMKLLDLEVELRNVESNFTLNDSTKMLETY